VADEQNSDPKQPEAVSGEAGESLPDGSPAETAEEDDFARMLEESLEARSIEKGQTVEGVLVSLSHDVAFIDVGGKGEATMDPQELCGDDGEFQAKVGDRIQGVVVSTAGGIRLSHHLARTAASKEQLRDAFHAGLPVEGKVEKVNKGGYEVRVAGQRAFCPLSQIDTVRGIEPAGHEGKVYTFRILEFKNDGKELVVSRRAILEEEQRREAVELMQRVVPGAELPGRVVSVRDYGAFVDLGAGVQGLLHVSEMGWTRVSSAAAVVEVGQEISVQVVKVDPESRKISLSLRHLHVDPWLKVEENYVVGKMAQGRVTRLADFGAFVELEPGVEALAHMSTFPPTKGGWKAAVQVGERGRFRIQSVEPDRRRIGVALVDAATEDELVAPAPAEGASAGGSEQDQPEGEGFGSLADKLRAAMKRREKDG
jgi:small subunit ribosomal protein S1